MPNENEPWKDLTIFDMLVVTFAVAVGCALAVADRESYRYPETAPGDARVFLHGLLIGLQFSAPLIVAYQFMFRGRRRRLSVAEVIWFAPLVLYLIAAVIVLELRIILPNFQSEAVAGVFSVVMFVVALSAAGELLIGVCEAFKYGARKAGWYWGDYLGCLFCFFAAGYFGFENLKSVAMRL